MQMVVKVGLLTAALFLRPALSFGQIQPEPEGYSIATPRPINPAASTTNPSALATQSQNRYLGSTPAGTVTDEVIPLSLRVERGLRYNLGMIESSQATTAVRAQRLRALSALLPDISFKGQQAFEDLSLKEIGLKLPPISGFPGLPATTGAFGYQEARVSLTQSLYSTELRDRYRAQKDAEQASAFSTRDARDVVVYAVGVAYLQVVASAARVETARAQLTSAEELDQQTANQVKNEVSPEIDSIRAQVERQTAEQRLINATDAFEKDKLALGRIIGIPIDQKFALVDTAGYRPISDLTQQSATAEAVQTRADLRSAEANVRPAQYGIRAEKAQRLPAFLLHADYGGAGVNVGSFDSVYTLAGSISFPVFTGGRIRADIDEARANLARRQAEYKDLKARVAYDVRIAWLDLQASDSGVRVAGKNQALAERAAPSIARALL